MIRTLGAIVDAGDAASALIARLQQGLHDIERAAVALPRHPHIYFEEWNDPLIAGIGWVSELIAIAGGEDCFAELAAAPAAAGRIIADSGEVIARAPDIIIGSWCGKRFRPAQLRARAGWEAIPAVRDGHVYEIKSCDILQPGPAALSDGVRQIHAIVRRWVDG
jgi:iron complex transport system substrate-binding protein